MGKQLKKKEVALNADNEYKSFLNNIKEQLRVSQIRAALSVNRELIQFYWKLGNELIERQAQHKWGERFLEQFSCDMRQEFPEMQGFSVRNLRRMRQFSQVYPDFLIRPQAVAELPWGHISVLLAIKEVAVRDWYAENTIKNGWSRSVLEMQIESGLYGRQGIISHKSTNYHEYLPALQSELANEIIKDPYNFDFLTIHGEAHERAIENALVTHIKDFLLELGRGFAFVGSQVPLTFDDQEFFVDLLFYHLDLRCFIVIELKAGKFKPEYTGQLGFYLAAVDDMLKKPSDNRSIGVLLCKSKNKIIAEYALRSSNMPIGVSEYELSKALPKEFKTSLPTIEEIEKELNEVIDIVNEEVLVEQEKDKKTQIPNEKIKNIKIKYKFKKSFDLLEKINQMPTYVAMSMLLVNGKPRLSKVKTDIEKLKKVGREFVKLLRGTPTSTKAFLNEVPSQLNKEWKDIKAANHEWLMSSFERDLNIFNDAISHGYEMVPKDMGGRKVNSISKTVIFKLAAIYKIGTGFEPTCCWLDGAEVHAGKFYEFLLELRSVLDKMGLKLGTEKTIGVNAVKVLSVYRKTFDGLV